MMKLRGGHWTVRDVFITCCILVAFIFYTGRSVYSPMKSDARSDLDLSKAGTLKMVVVVHRHGARTPLTALFWPDTVYSSCASHGRYDSGPSIKLLDERKLSSSLNPLDLGTSQLPGGCRMGQLTKKGHEQGAELGRWLRSRYVYELSLLPVQLTSPTIISFRSTLYERAILTLQGVISGLYPELTPRDIIKVNATSEAYEIEYGKNTTCPKLGPIFSSIEYQQEKAEVTAGLASLRERVMRDLLKSPSSSNSNLNWIRLYDSIVAMEAEGMDWPDGLTSSLRSEISVQALRHEAQVVNPVPGDGITSDRKLSEKVVRLSIGPLIHRIMASLHQSKHSDGKVNRKLGINKGDSGPKMMVFSGHDSTLSPLLVALGRPFQSWPPFASSLVFELWQSKVRKVQGHEKGAMVRVLFNREPLRVEGGSDKGWISLTALDALLKPYSIEEDGKEKECVTK